jgi:uncharacterized membrane protein YbhN (UPF0104 family)
MSRGAWAWARLAGGAAILAVLVWRVGTGPILDGLRSISAGPLAAAAGIAVVTTVCSAWRWRLVARALDVGISMNRAVAAYYRSQFLNTALPGGVLGDVHRAVRHGRDVGDVGRGLRAVVWERVAGQVVQVVLALIVLSVLPSPVRSSMRIVVPAVLVAALAVGGLIRVRARRRMWLPPRSAWPGIALASIVVVVGHTGTFLIAARTAGSSASLAQLLPLAMLVLLAMAVPTNIGGWGPREGVAAWAFAAAGLSAGQGVAAATVYGVMVLVACLPGAAVLVVGWLRRSHSPAPAVVWPKGVVRG